MNKNWLRYLFRNYRVPLIFWAVVFFALSAIPMIETDDIWNDFMGSVEIMSVLAVMMTFILPVILFAFVHKRRSSDQLLALPLSRKEMLITNLAFAFMIIFGSCFFTSVLLWLIKAVTAVPFTRLLAILGASALMTVCLLCVHTFWFLIAGNTFDGIVMIGSYSFLPLLIFGVITSFVTNTVAGGNFRDTGELAMWLSPLAMNIRNLNFSLAAQDTSFSWTYTLLCAAYTLLACYGLQSQFVTRKSERAQQLSDHPMAYRLIINLYAFALLLMIGMSLMSGFSYEYLTLYLLLLFIYVVAQFVYRRKIQLNVRIFTAFGALLISSLLLAFAAYRTHGFGLAEKYTYTDNAYLTMNYGATVEKDLTTPTAADTGLWVYVDAEVTIPVSEISPDNEVWQVMEKYRRAGISSFYTGGGSQRNQEYLHFSNTGSPGSHMTENLYTYYIDDCISVEDLKTIDNSKYSTVTITDYTDVSGTSYSLSEWLGKKGD